MFHWLKSFSQMLSKKEEAKLNDEKRVWRASFKDYLTESEIVASELPDDFTTSF
ncbi:hypothetical protein [Enterococcus hirae]|uniref:hypothetical protein n=1 Tax=Enterococcus hirae TaxID=1354 RepID=UPI00211B49D5